MLKFLKDVLGGNFSFCANFDKKVKPHHAALPFPLYHYSP